MRLRAYGCAAALATLVLAGCDRPPRVDNVTPDSDKTTAASEREHSDPLVTARVQAKYFVSPAVKAHRIDVDTRNGIVTLEGTVDTDAQRQAAGEIAKAVDGVARVENRLLVRPAGGGNADAQRHHTQDSAVPGRSGRTPAWITAKIQSQYYLNPELKPWRIDVDTASSGTVTLSGTVDSDADRAEAVKIARATEGVTNVTDNLLVQPRSVATSGPAKDTTAVRNDANEIKEAIDDSWITMKIQSKYFIHEEIKSRKVDVDTKKGVVTLKGAVPSDVARRAAEVIAQDTDGVSRVVNNLKVDSRS
jgi:hyperosmotically inducible protein